MPCAVSAEYRFESKRILAFQRTFAMTPHAIVFATERGRFCRNTVQWVTPTVSVILATHRD